MSELDPKNWQKWKVEVDPESCAGCGNCAEICPAVFKMDYDEGISIADSAAVTAENAASVIEAKNVCPSQAIIITETN